jgi:hypothetical protein
VNWSFVRREWGAVSFVLTVIVGMIIVPLALYFANQGPGPLSIPNTPVTSSPRASGVHPTPSPTPTPTKKPTPTPTK